MDDYTFSRYELHPTKGLLISTSAEVFSYPMGDVTVRPVGQDPLPGSKILEGMWVHTASPDMVVIHNWAQLASSLGMYPCVLVLPYLPGARGDKDTPSPARTFAKLIGTSWITDLVVLDPHSPVWLNTFRHYASPSTRVHELSLRDIVFSTIGVHAADNFGAKSGPNLDKNGFSYAGVIGPDAGSIVRAAEVADRFGVPVVIADKHRDPETGKLSGYRLPTLPDPHGEYLVVDDICDGGGTFGLLAGEAPDTATLDLWVSHGGFTGGKRTQSALERYRSVFTTDSLPSAVRAGEQFDKIHVFPLAGTVHDVIMGIFEEIDPGNREGVS